jgi:thiamine biosynthesis protein ThiI
VCSSDLVDVRTPDVTVWAEVREDAAYVHAGSRLGAGGLPYGMSGKAALLLSGGIDSPVAGWRMARRGAELIAVHFHSYPYTSQESLQKILTLASILSQWTIRIYIYIVSFTTLQERIRAEAPEGVSTLLLRRSMCRTACAIAARDGCGALVTGESLGQVASQTMDALAVTQQASALPVLRPLIGMDKDEIVSQARAIGTFDTSVLPYEDCCTIFTPRHPNTKPRLEYILECERNGTWRELEAAAAESAERRLCQKITVT